jgi:hypothetical protein
VMKRTTPDGKASVAIRLEYNMDEGTTPQLIHVLEETIVVLKTMGMEGN